MPKASVKVMRSYDYCHFEIALSSDENLTLDEVNELRKSAAILVDEAVREYREAKSKESRRESREWEVAQLIEKIARLKKKPPGEHSVEEMALLRSAADHEFFQQYHQDDYYYDEDTEREHHFSMLRKFKETRIAAGKAEP